MVVDRRSEQLRRDSDRLRGGRLLLDDPHLETLVVSLEDRQLVAVRRQRRDRLLELDRRGDVELDEPMRDREVGGSVTEVGAEPSAPAFELGERTGEALPACLGELHLAAVAVVHVDVAEALPYEEVLELRVLLEVELLAPELDLVERRYRRSE